MKNTVDKTPKICYTKIKGSEKLMEKIANKTETSKKITIRSGEQYLRLMKSATTQEEKKLYTKTYNAFLAKRQKEVIANEFY